MFEAYKVAVKITLVNEVTKNLTAMSALFGKLGKDVDVLQSKLNKLKKVAVVGGVSLGAGLLGLKAFGKMLKPGEDYAHQLNIMNMAGLKQQEIAEATAAAWQLTGKVLTTTATGNLKTILDLRNVFGSTKEAIAYAPEIARIGTVMRASSEGSVKDNADNLAYSIAKALDIRGAVNSPAVFSEQAEAMAKVITAFQGRVLPSDYQQLFKYSRQATQGLSNQFLYEELPSLMMEMKGKSGSGGQGGFGTSLAAFYRFFVQGTMTKSAMAGLQSIGLLPQGVGLKTTTVGTQLKFGEHVKNVDLAATDPFLYTENVIMPLIRKKYGDHLSKEKLNLIIGQIMKGAPQLAIFAVEQYANKAQNIHRDQKLIKQAASSTQAIKMAMSADPVTAMAALTAQWTNFEAAFTMGVIPILVPGLISLTRWLNEFSQWMRDNPNFTKYVAEGFMGVSALLVTMGTITLPAATIGIWRLNKAIIGLTGATNAAAGVSGAKVAGAAGASALVGVGTTAAVGLLAYGGYQLWNIIKDIWALTATGGPLDPKTPSYQRSPLQQYGVSTANATVQDAAKQPISLVLQVDGRTLAQITSEHLTQQLNQHQLTSPGQINVQSIPIPVSTYSFPFTN
jgi:hypothetical protein